MDWMPIETVPRNGKWFLATDGENCIVLNWPKDCYMGRWHKYKSSWVGMADSSIDPTHWMPLPKMPISPHPIVSKTE